MRSNNYLKYILPLLITIFVSGIISAQNMAFVFDGESSYLSSYESTDENLYFGPNDNGFSIEAWVYLFGDNGEEVIPVINKSKGGSEVFSLFIQSGR